MVKTLSTNQYALANISIFNGFIKKHKEKGKERT